MDILVPVILAGGGIAYVLSQGEPDATPPDNYYGPNNSIPVSGSSPGTSLGSAVVNGNQTPVGGNLSATKRAVLSSLTDKVQLSPNMYPYFKDPELQQKYAEIEDYAKAAYQNLDDASKKAAADELNKQLKLDPPLKGDESWQELSGIVGGAAGGALGAYLGGPIGAKLGAIVGSYLGVQIEDLISKNADDLKNWLEGEWGDIKRQVESWYDDVKDAGGDAWDTLTSWI